ncbi:hypothetical protein [Bacteroides sp.]|uniref:hypothetical protein n=1 Tax=Bacteroides sp. TaxID=29523 RepID=UPI00261C3868|nr:hypothetical protein [Bacteroides sp.]MDD3040307.1 hypothetical protein [Bacteroides sp.]
MRYAIIKDPEKIGMDPDLFTKTDQGIIVNENDIFNSNIPGDTVEEKAKNAGTELISLETLKNKTRNGK